VTARGPKLVWQYTLLIAASLLVGCQTEEPPVQPGGMQADVSTFQAVAKVVSGEVVPLPALPAAGGALFIEADRNFNGCFQLDGLFDSAGQNLVEAVGAASNCGDCGQRVMLGRGGAMVLLPPRPLATPSMLGAIRVSARNCATGNPVSDAVQALPLHLAVVPLADPPRAETLQRLELAVYVDGDELFEGHAETTLQTVAQHLRFVFAQAHIDVSVAAVCIFDSGRPEVVFSTGEPTELRQVLAMAQRACPFTPTRLPVVIAGCLRREDALGGSISFPIGETTHIPGTTSGLAEPDFVAVAGRSCGFGTPIVWTSWSLGQVIAHEVGHFLGLFHSVETNGLADDLADTDAKNLMHYNPLATSSAGFSAAQIAIMRRHPQLQGLLTARKWPH
jgi:hypothetical protein